MFPQLFVLYSLFNDRNPNIDEIYNLLIQPGIEESIKLEGLASKILYFRNNSLPAQLISLVKGRLQQILVLEYNRDFNNKLQLLSNDKFVRQIYTSNPLEFRSESIKLPTQGYRILPHHFPNVIKNGIYGTFSITLNTPFSFAISYDNPKGRNIVDQFIQITNLSPKDRIPFAIVTPDQKLIFDFDLKEIFQSIYYDYSKLNRLLYKPDQYLSLDLIKEFIVNPDLFTFFMKPSVPTIHLEHRIDVLEYSLRLPDIDDPRFNTLKSKFVKDKSQQIDKTTGKFFYQYKKYFGKSQNQILDALEDYFMFRYEIESLLDEFFYDGTLQTNTKSNESVFCFNFSGDNFVCYFNYGGIKIDERLKTQIEIMHQDVKKQKEKIILKKDPSPEEIQNNLLEVRSLFFEPIFFTTSGRTPQLIVQYRQLPFVSSIETKKIPRLNFQPENNFIPLPDDFVNMYSVQEFSPNSSENSEPVLIFSLTRSVPSAIIPQNFSSRTIVIDKDQFIVSLPRSQLNQIKGFTSRELPNGYKFLMSPILPSKNYMITIAASTKINNTLSSSNLTQEMYDLVSKTLNDYLNDIINEIINAGYLTEISQVLNDEILKETNNPSLTFIENFVKNSLGSEITDFLSDLKINIGKLLDFNFIDFVAESKIPKEFQARVVQEIIKYLNEPDSFEQSIQNILSQNGVKNFQVQALSKYEYLIASAQDILFKEVKLGNFTATFSDLQNKDFVDLANPFFQQMYSQFMIITSETDSSLEIIRRLFDSNTFAYLPKIFDDEQRRQLEKISNAIFNVEKNAYYLLFNFDLPILSELFPKDLNGKPQGKITVKNNINMILINKESNYLTLFKNNIRKYINETFKIDFFDYNFIVKGKEQFLEHEQRQIVFYLPNQHLNAKLSRSFSGIGIQISEISELFEYVNVTTIKVVSKFPITFQTLIDLNYCKPTDQYLEQDGTFIVATYNVINLYFEYQDDDYLITSYPTRTESEYLLNRVGLLPFEKFQDIDTLLISNDSQISIRDCGLILDQQSLHQIHNLIYDKPTKIPEQDPSDNPLFETERQLYLDLAMEENLKYQNNLDQNTATFIIGSTSNFSTTSQISIKSRWRKWSPNGDYVAIGHAPGVLIFGVVGNQLSRIQNLEHEGASEIIFGKLGYILTLQYEDSRNPFAIVWNIMTGTKIMTFPYLEDYMFEFSPLYIASSSTQKESKKYFTITNLQGKTIFGGTEDFETFKWSPNGQDIVVIEVKTDRNVEKRNLLFLSSEFLGRKDLNILQKNEISRMPLKTDFPDTEVYDQSITYNGKREMINRSMLRDYATIRIKGFWIFSLFIVQDKNEFTVHDSLSMTCQKFTLPNTKDLSLKNFQIHIVEDNIQNLYFIHGQTTTLFPFTEPQNFDQMLPMLNGGYYTWNRDKLFLWFYQEGKTEVTFYNEDEIVSLSFSEYYAIIPEEENLILFNNKIVSIPLSKISELYVETSFEDFKDIKVTTSLEIASYNYEITSDPLTDQYFSYPISSLLAQVDKNPLYQQRLWRFSDYNKIAGNRSFKTFTRENLIFIVVDDEIYILPLLVPREQFEVVKIREKIISRTQEIDQIKKQLEIANKEYSQFQSENNKLRSSLKNLKKDSEESKKTLRIINTRNATKGNKLFQKVNDLTFQINYLDTLYQGYSRKIREERGIVEEEHEDSEGEYIEEEYEDDFPIEGPSEIFFEKRIPKSYFQKILLENQSNINFNPLEELTRVQVIKMKFDLSNLEGVTDISVVILDIVQNFMMISETDPFVITFNAKPSFKSTGDAKLDELQKKYSKEVVTYRHEFMLEDLNFDKPLIELFISNPFVSRFRGLQANNDIIPIIYSSQTISKSTFVEDLDFKRPLFLTSSSDAQDSINFVYYGIFEGGSLKIQKRDSIFMYNNSPYCIIWSNQGNSQKSIDQRQESYKYANRKLGVLVIHNLKTNKVINISPSDLECDPTGQFGEYFGEFKQVWIQDEGQDQIIYFIFEGSTKIHFVSFTFLLQDSNISTSNIVKQRGNFKSKEGAKAIQKTSGRFISNKIKRRSDKISNYSISWSPNGKFFAIWYTYDFGTSISIYNREMILIFKKELVMFETYQLIMEKDQFLVGGIGQGFPGREIRFGRIKYLDYQEIPFVKYESVINCFDSETKAPKIKVNNITFFKMVNGVNYFAIYSSRRQKSSNTEGTKITNIEIDHYLRIEGFLEDQIIKLSEAPIDISTSIGNGYVAIQYETKTEIWNLLGVRVDVISGKAFWRV